MKEIGCACPLCDGDCDKCVCKLAEGPGEHLSCFERAERIKSSPKLQQMIKALQASDPELENKCKMP